MKFKIILVLISKLLWYSLFNDSPNFPGGIKIKTNNLKEKKIKNISQIDHSLS
jgi:hypothetical protein